MMKHLRKQFLPFNILLATAMVVATSCAKGADELPVAESINRFGLDLHRRLAAEGGNIVTSPWSIESALAMTWCGAAGETGVEMAKVLHLTGDENAIHKGFSLLADDLARLEEVSRKAAEGSARTGRSEAPMEIRTANRLFGQKDFAFLPEFLDKTEKFYGAPLEPMDFKRNPDSSRKKINGWVEQQTEDRIKDLIPEDVIDALTRMVLTNAIYFKASWSEKFSEEPEAPFFVDGTGESVPVAGLVNTDNYGFLKIPGGVAVAVPYAGGGLRFVIYLPDEKGGLEALENQLTPKILADAAKAKQQRILLHLPSFKLEPDRVMLSSHLIAMGMPSAFDKPGGSADFSAMVTPKTLDEYLSISNVIHKAFITVNKDGTEAAAATAVVMAPGMMAPGQVPTRPLEIRVDRPFVFTVQHVTSGTCLFLGRVTDPR